MKKFFVFGLFSLLIIAKAFSAEFSQASGKLYKISYLNMVYTVQVNPNNTTIANLPGIGICKGKLSGRANVAKFNYFGESSVGGQCEHADFHVIEYSNDTLGIVESMRIGATKGFLGYLRRSDIQIGIRISRVQ